MYSIYKITNKVNGKIYIGKTKNRPYDRFKGHVSLANKGSDLLLHRAIRKYGVESFIFEVIDQSAKSVKEMNDLERSYIYNLKSTDRNVGYNITRGGDGGDSEFARNMQKGRVSDGTHHWLRQNLTDDDRKLYNEKRFANRPNPWSGDAGSKHNKTVAERRVADGTHPWVGVKGTEQNLKRIKEGSHPFIQKHTCPHCNKEGKGTMMFRYHFDNCKFKDMK